MKTRDEYARQAEDVLQEARRSNGPYVDTLIAKAQVYATLAVAARNAYDDFPERTVIAAAPMRQEFFE